MAFSTSLYERILQRKVEVDNGRHTLISPALAGGRTRDEVRDAAGHAKVAITSAYLHVAVEDEEGVGNLFGNF